MSVYPTQIEREGEDQLVIQWSDGERRRYRVRQLRDQCPCATCREKRSKPMPMLPVLDAAQTTPLRVESMKPVGSYAYSIAFSDGHDSGIFTFDLLRQLGST